MKLKLSAAGSVALMMCMGATAWGAVSPADPRALSASIGDPMPLIAGQGSLTVPWKTVPSTTTNRFRDQTDQQALDTAHLENPELFASQSTRTLDPPVGSTIKKYLDDYSARIDVAGGKADVIATSTTPLRVERNGVMRAVDLKLVDAGDAVEPKAPVVPLSFAHTLGGGVTIAEDIRIRVVGADPATPARVDGQQVFYANALADSDVFDTPTPTGFESFVQLRSAQSPHHLVYQFDLPRGARLAQEPGGSTVAIVRGDSLLATITTPISIDANDVLVPTTITVDGSRVVLDVSIGSATAFPVVVDPAVVDNQFTNGDGATTDGSFQNTLGWRRETTGALANFTFSPNGDNPSAGGQCLRYLKNSTTPQYLQQQLCVSTQSSRAYTGEMGQWAWRPPAGTRSILNDGANVDTDAYIYLAQVRHSYTRLSTSGGAQMYAGIRSGRTGAWIGRNYNVDQGGVASDYRDGAWSYGAGVSGVINNPSFLRTYCAATDCSIEHPNEPNYDGASFAFGAYALGSGHALSANAQGAIFYQYDRTPPTALHTPVTNLSGWKSGGTATTSVSGTDAGMGMKSVGIAYTDKNGTAAASTYADPCSGGILHNCPRSLAHAFVVGLDSLPEGTDQIGSITFDILGKQTSGPALTVNIDRTGPAFDVPQGALWDHRGAPLTDQTYPVTVVARDGDPTANMWHRSGVKSVDVVLEKPDGSIVQTSVDPSPQACPAGNCTKSRTWQLDTDSVDDGTYIVKAVAKDELDQTTAYSWTITVDRRPPAPTDVELEGFDNDTASATIGWNIDDDPSLPNADANSQVRYRLGTGVWSAWQDAQSNVLQIAGVGTNAAIDLEVKAVNAIGIASSTVAQTVNAVVEDTGLDFPEGSVAGADAAVTVELAQLDGTTTPVGGLPITMTDGAGVHTTASTGDDGVAYFDGMAPGQYTVVPAQSGGVTATTNNQLIVIPGQRAEHLIHLEITRPPSAAGTGAQAAALPSGAQDFFSCIDEIPVKVCAQFVGDAIRATFVTNIIFSTGSTASYAGGVPDDTRANAFKHSYAVSRFTRTMLTKYKGVGPVSWAYDFAHHHEIADEQSSVLKVRQSSFMDTNNNLVAYNYAVAHPTRNGTQLCSTMRTKSKHARFARYADNQSTVPVPPDSERTQLIFNLAFNPSIQGSGSPTDPGFFPDSKPCKYALARYDQGFDGG